MEETFLKAIFEAPADNLPRMAYADWLMEQSEQERRDRGEFIACQLRMCEAYYLDWRSWGYQKNSAELPVRRAAELWGQWADKWSDTIHCYQANLIWRRGFIQTIEYSMSWRHLNEVGKAISDTHPVEELLLQDVWYYSAIFATPQDIATKLIETFSYLPTLSKVLLKTKSIVLASKDEKVASLLRESHPGIQIHFVEEN